MAEALNLQEMRKRIGATSLTRKGDVFLARLGFFYTHGRTADDLAGKVLASFPGATILEKKEIWKAFNGGAPVSRQSHWLVKFKLKTKGGKS